MFELAATFLCGFIVSHLGQAIITARRTRNQQRAATVQEARRGRIEINYAEQVELIARERKEFARITDEMEAALVAAHIIITTNRGRILKRSSAAADKWLANPWVKRAAARAEDRAAQPGATNNAADKLQ